MREFSGESEWITLAEEVVEYVSEDQDLKDEVEADGLVDEENLQADQDTQIQGEHSHLYLATYFLQFFFKFSIRSGRSISIKYSQSQPPPRWSNPREYLIYTVYILTLWVWKRLGGRHFEQC